MYVSIARYLSYKMLAVSKITFSGVKMLLLMTNVYQLVC